MQLLKRDKVFFNTVSMRFKELKENELQLLCLNPFAFDYNQENYLKTEIK